MYGEKLKTIRKQLSATQEQMAEYMAVSYRTYASYERNENNPPYSMLVFLCKEYNINLNWFIADVGEMFNDKSVEQSELEEKITPIVEKILKNKGIK